MSNIKDTKDFLILLKKNPCAAILLLLAAGALLCFFSFCSELGADFGKKSAILENKSGGKASLNTPEINQNSTGNNSPNIVSEGEVNLKYDKSSE